MITEQITEYLNKYSITTKELLAEHILQLKRNTYPNVKLISELIWVLNDSSIFNFFSAEKKLIKGIKVVSTPKQIEKIQELKSFFNNLSNQNTPMFLDEILEQSNTNSTRHKSKNGECHGELVLYKRNEINKEKVFKNWNKCIIRHGTTSTSKVANTVGQHGIIKNTLSVDKSIYEAGKKKGVKQEQFEIDAELQYEKDFKNGDLPIGITGNWEEDKEGYLKFFGKKEEAKNYFLILNEGEEISELKILGEIRRDEQKIIEDLERKEVVSVGVKENEGKTDYSEINLDILDLMASRFNANKHKYPKDNMKKQINIKSLEWALFRHLKKMIQPIEGDKENYKDHISAILCNASMILDQIDKK